MTDFVFGDAEPEDAWDAGDPIGVLLDNLGRRCGILGEPPRVHSTATDWEWLIELSDRLHRLIIRRDDLDDRDRARLDLIAQDVAYLRTRLEAADG
jgi:hypothetical protein